MANIGDKFIIEIKELGVRSDTYYLKNSMFNHIVIPERVLKGFEKYDPESEYQRGLHDAWEAARKIAGFPSLGGLNTHELMKFFDTDIVAQVMAELTAKQAIEKLRDYEAKKKVEEEIRVGDEVETTAFNKVIVLKHLHDGYYAALNDQFEKVMIHLSGIVKKTGRHFPQVAELLAAMIEDGDTDG